MRFIKVVRGICSLVALGLFVSCGQPIQETKPITKNITKTVFASGILEADNMYSLTAKTTGYLTQVNFEEGNLVKQGEVLAIIENEENKYNAENARKLYQIAENNTKSSAPILRQAQTSVDNARKQMLQDKSVADRYARLLKSESVARIDYENAQLQYQISKKEYEAAIEFYNQQKQDAQERAISNKTQKQINNLILKDNQVKAPYGGKVYEKLKEVGDYVKAGDIIATLGDPDFVYAKVNIDESNISEIKVGQAALIQLNTNKEKTYTAEVWKIQPSFNQEDQSFTCLLKFKEDLDFKIINTQLESNITVGTEKGALLIPRNFLYYGGYIHIKGNKEKTKVKVNFVSNEWVQILSDLDPDVTLITTEIN